MQQSLEQIQEEDESYNAVPICGSNFSTPVVNTLYYIDELRWTIGGRQYIDHAD